MSSIANVIYRHISESGPISFARFMEWALHCPELGYYERLPHRIGRKGDFFTSVSVGPLFGQLLAVQFCRWLTEIEVLHGRLKMVEAAAHDGQLARDILDWLTAHAPDVLARIDYVLVEPSARRERWQREKLGELVQHVKWCRGWEEAQEEGIDGVIFSNELLDSFPVHRFGWDARLKHWFEYGVTVEGNRLQWCCLPVHGKEQAILGLEIPREVVDILPDGFVVERSPMTRQWWRQAANALEQGWLMTIDYGFDTGWALDPTRPQGTLRGYRRHQRVLDLLADPGEQDLTAHVDFAALREAGESEGLHTQQLVSQGRFLTRILQEHLRVENVGFEWSASSLRQLQSLTHPDQLGERFRVLVQRRPIGNVGCEQR